MYYVAMLLETPVTLLCSKYSSFSTMLLKSGLPKSFRTSSVGKTRLTEPSARFVRWVKRKNVKTKIRMVDFILTNQ